MVDAEKIKAFYSESCKFVESMAAQAEVDNLQLYYEPAEDDAQHFKKLKMQKWEILNALGYASQGKDEQEIQEILGQIATINGTTAYKIDKMLCLICTGNFYLHKKIYPNKTTFLRIITRISEQK